MLTCRLRACCAFRRLILRILHNLAHDVESRIRQTSDNIIETVLSLGGLGGVSAAARIANKRAAAVAKAGGAAGAGGEGKDAADDDDDDEDAGALSAMRRAVFCVAGAHYVGTI
jgi:hypothetical protein